MFNYVNSYDFEPRTEEGDFVDKIDNEVEVLDIEIGDLKVQVNLDMTYHCTTDFCI